MHSTVRIGNPARYLRGMAACRAGQRDCSLAGSDNQGDRPNGPCHASNRRAHGLTAVSGSAPIQFCCPCGSTGPQANSFGNRRRVLQRRP